MGFEKGAKRRSTVLLSVMAATFIVAALASFRPPGSPLDRLLNWIRPPADAWPTIETVSALPPAVPAPGIGNTSNRTADLVNWLDNLPYELDSVRSGTPVPPAFVVQFPKDMKKQTSGASRKDLFARIILPLALYSNELILLQRQRMLAIHDSMAKGHRIPEDDQEFLNDLAKRFKTTPDNLTELKNRVDVIPPSLVLAQGATETAWGTSRFAQVGNAIFGQWTWNPAEGILPLRRTPGLKHFIKAYPTLFASVTDYMRNINSHKAYTKLRHLRAIARKNDRTASGFILAAGLDKYSEKGFDYVIGLRSLMQKNGYAALDEAKLARQLTPTQITELN